MNYQSNVSNQMPSTTMFQGNTENLQEQIAQLTEWKHKATVQLEHFRSACRIYNFCEWQQLNELLNQ